MASKHNPAWKWVALIGLLLGLAACTPAEPTTTATAIHSLSATATPAVTSEPTAAPTPTPTTSPAAPLPTPTPSAGIGAFIWPGETTVRPGGTLEVSVWVNPGGSGISGGEIQVFFPPEVFEAVDVQAGTLLGPEPLVGYRDISNAGGVVRLAIARIGPTDVPSPQGSFAVLLFRCKESASTGQYRLDLKIGLANERFEDIDLASVRGGQIIVKAPDLPEIRSIAGRVTTVNVQEDSFVLFQPKEEREFTVMLGEETEFIRLVFPFDINNPPADATFTPERELITMDDLQVGNQVFVRSSHAIRAGEDILHPLEIQVLP